MSSRFVPSQYATVFYPRIQGRACLTGFFSRAENALQRALEDALRQRPEANGLALTEFWFDGRECFVVEGTPVRLK